MRGYVEVKGEIGRGVGEGGSLFCQMLTDGRQQLLKGFDSSSQLLCFVSY